MTVETIPRNLFRHRRAGAYLKEVLDEKLASNPRFSLRAFARTLGLSPSAMSAILLNQKKLSIERAADIARRLKFTEQEIEYFVLMVIAEKTRDPELRKCFFRWMDRFCRQVPE